MYLDHNANKRQSLAVSAGIFLFLICALIPLAEAVQPVAVADTYSTPISMTLTVAAPGLLTNDSDPDGDAITASRRTSPTHGTVTVFSTGRFVYVPTSGYVGSDSFTYWVSDPTSARVSGTVTINVVNTAPVAVNDTYATLVDTPLTVAANGVLANDTDANGDTLTATATSLPAQGSLSLASDGGFVYTPAAGYSGSDSFSYTVDDGHGGSATAIVALTVSASNTAPQAAADTYSATQDITLTVTAPGVLSNDTDADGDTLTAAVAGLPANGTLSLAGNGGFVYTPASGYTGTDSFTYTVSDGLGASATATVTIVVNAVNQAPVAVNDAYTTPLNTKLTVAVPGVLSNDSDPNGDAITASRRTSPVNGTLTIKTAGNIVYTPTTGFTGTDTFTYWASDALGKRSWATVTITVTPVNTFPAAINDVYTTPQDTSLSIAAPGVLGNDSDSDGDPLTASVASQPLQGSLNLAADGGFVYTPTAGYIGSDSFTYTVVDGRGGSATASVTLSVDPVLANTAPNFIFIVTDDMRADDDAYMPNLHTLIADNGVTFPNAYTNVSLCCPARASILRGQYVHNHGVLDNDAVGTPGGFLAFHDLGLENSTIATWMQAAGYRTALIGKYLNEYGTNNSEAFIPPGWDEWYALINTQNFLNYQMNQNGTIISYGAAETDYQTDVISGLAVDFVRRASTAGQPFFLYLTPTAPHKPYVPAPRHVNALPEVTQAPRPPSFNEADVSDKPLYVQALPIMGTTAIAALDSNYRTKLQMLLSVDEMIGALVTTLAEKGELGHTYILFTSDNAVTMAEHRLNDLKSSPYEESIHVPLMVRVPGMENSPAVRDDIVMLPDMGPTIAEIAGAATDSFVDGSSFAGALGTTASTGTRQRMLVEYLGGPSSVSYYHAMRSRDQLYVEYLTGETELYDMQNDPYQLCNLLGIDPLNPPPDCFIGALTPTLEQQQLLSSQLQALQNCSAASCATAEQ